MAPNRQISTRRRAQATDDVIPDSIFDAVSMPGQQEPKVQAKKKDEPTIAQVMERLGALSQRIEDSERQSAVTDTFRGQPAASPAVFNEAIPQMNLDNLPDPVSNPKEYGAAIAAATLKYQNDLSGWENRRQQAVTPPKLGDPDAVFEEFAEQFPEYVENEERITFATAQVSKKLAKKGIDVQKYLFTKSPQLFKEIIKTYDDVFGKPEGLGEDGDATGDEPVTPTRPKPRQVQAADDDANDDEGRTEGIFGGGEPGAGPARGAAPKPGDLIKDIQDMQRKSGYF